MQINNDLILKTENISLSLITENDQDALLRMAQDLRIWQYNPSFTDPNDFLEKWFIKAIEQKNQRKRYPFAIHYQGETIGSTSFYDIDDKNKTITIGYTWLHPDYWAKGINAKVKQLLLDYAFNQSKMHEVYFVIDILNLRSRAPVLKLGAKEKEIYRNHLKRPDCTMRDSMVYVITEKMHKISKIKNDFLKEDKQNQWGLLAGELDNCIRQVKIWIDISSASKDLS